MILTKHAKERYIQRFGFQEDKTIIHRAELAKIIHTKPDGTQKRVFGNIVFMVLLTEEPIITTIWRKN